MIRNCRRTRKFLYGWGSCTPDATASARAALRRALDAYGLSMAVSADAVLVTSELVANATEHAAGPYELWLQCGFYELICEVHDQDPSVPRRPVLPAEPLFAPDPRDRGGGLDALCRRLSERGRGLQIVDQLTRGRWGFLLPASGKKVAWAAFPTQGKAVTCRGERCAGARPDDRHPNEG